jgi:hypothetical protein
MTLTAVMAVIAVLFPYAPLGGAPPEVRLLEGNTRGVLVLRSFEGEPIGHGELRQTPGASVIESRLVLTFRDGSLRGETATFSQRGVFRLESYSCSAVLHCRRRRSHSIGTPAGTGRWLRNRRRATRRPRRDLWRCPTVYATGWI